MTTRILILNLGLSVLLALGGVKLRQDWRAFEPAHEVAAIQPAPQTFSALSAAVATQAAISDWTDIPGHNVFSFDRTDIDIAPVVETAPPKPLGPKPILFGTMILGLERHAFVAPGPTGNKNYKEMGVGQEVDGWTLVEVRPTSIIVESNGTRQTVTMNDPVAQVARETGKTTLGAGPAVIQSTQPPRPTVSTPAPAAPAANAPAPQTQPGQPRMVPVQGLFGIQYIEEGAIRKP